MGKVVLGGAHGDSDRLILKTRDAESAGMQGRSSGGTWDGKGVLGGAHGDSHRLILSRARDGAGGWGFLRRCRAGFGEFVYGLKETFWSERFGIR